MKLIISLCLCALALGCITPNPNQTPTVGADGQPVFPPAFVADTGAISNTLFKVQTGIQASAPVNPYAGLMTEAAAAFGALATAGSLLFGKVKSSQAKKAKAANTVLAQGVVKAGSQSAVLEVASSTPHFADVAHHLNEATV